MQNSDYVDDNLFQGIFKDIDRVAKATRDNLMSRGVSADSDEWKTTLSGVEDYVREKRRNTLKQEAIAAGKPEEFANYRASAYMNGDPVMRFSEWEKNRRNAVVAEGADFFGRSYLAVEGFLSGLVGGTASKIAYAHDHDPSLDAGPSDYARLQATKAINEEQQSSRNRFKKWLSQAKASGKDSLEYGDYVFRSDEEIDANFPLAKVDDGVASRIQHSASKGVKAYEVGQEWKNWAKSGIRMSPASMTQNPFVGLGAVGAMTLANSVNPQDDRLVSDLLNDTSGVGGFIGTVAGTTMVSAPAMVFPPALAAFLPVGYQGGQERAMQNWRKKAERARALDLPEPPKPTAEELNKAGNVAAVSEIASEGIGNAFEMAILLGKGTRAGNAINKGAKTVGEHGADSTARLSRNVLESFGSSAGSRGALGALKASGQIAKVGAIEATEEIANEVVVWDFVDGMQGEREISTLFRNAAEAGAVGFFAGAGTGVAVKTGQRIARRSEDKKIEAGKGPAMLTSVIEGISDKYALQRLNSMVVPAAGSKMVQHQLATFTGGGRTAIVVDGRHKDVTLTTEVKDAMVAAGIDIDAPIRQGNLFYYTSPALAQVVQNSVKAGDTVGITGNPNYVKADETVVGAAVIRDSTGQPVEVIPYGASANPEQVAMFAWMDAAAQPGLTVDMVDGASQAARISDLIASQVEADRATMGVKPRKDMKATPADVKTSIFNLKLAIAQQLREKMGYDPNVDVKVTLKPVARKYYSEGEKQIADAGVPATVLDGYIDVTTVGADGKKSTERMAIPMDGAYHHQMSEDGVFLIRENGDAMTFRSAFVVAVHEGGHRMVQRSRGGAQWMNMLVNLDPAFALRSGAAYMRKIDNSMAGMTDAEIINDMIARYEAAQSVLGSRSATAEQRATATEQMRDVERFAEESAAETLSETSGLSLGLASQYDRTYRYADNMSTMKFATWLAHVLVRNGFAGKHARAVLDMFSQRINKVREANVRMDAAYRKNARATYEKNLRAGMALQQQAQGEGAQTPADAATSAPSASMRGTPSGRAAVAAVTPPREEEKEGATLTEMAAGMIPSVASAIPLLTQTMAQIAPTGGASVRAPQATREQVEQRTQAAQPEVPAAAPVPAGTTRIVEPEAPVEEPQDVVEGERQVPEAMFSGRRNLRGEWWMTDTGPLFADGDVGDANHEMLAQEQAVRDFAGYLLDVASRSEDQNFKTRVSKFDAAIEKMSDLGRMDLNEASRTIRSSFEEEVDKIESELPDADRAMFRRSFDAATGEIDAREYGLEKGWSRIQGNNIQMSGITDSALRRVANQLAEVEDEEVLANQVFTIEDMSARRTYDDVPFEALDSGVSGLIPYRGARFSMRRPMPGVSAGATLESYLNSPFDISFSQREPKKRKPIARGKKAMISRIQQEYSRRDMPIEDVQFATDLMERIGGVDQTAIRFLGDKLMKKETGTNARSAGLFSFVNDMIMVGTDAVKSGDFRKVFAHEYWHKLTQYLSDAEVEKANADFLKAREIFTKKTGLNAEDYSRGGKPRAAFMAELEKQGIEHEEWYRLVNLDEWIAENMSDPTLERMELSEQSENILGFGRLLLRNALTSVKQVFGKGRYDAIARDFLEGGRTEYMPGLEPDIQARMRIPMIQQESRRAAAMQREAVREQAQAAAQAPIEAMFSVRGEPRFQDNPYKSQIRGLTSKIIEDVTAGRPIAGVKGNSMTRENWIAWAAQNGLPKSQMRWLMPWMFGNPLGIQRITVPTSHQDLDKLTPLQFAAELESAIGILLTPTDLGNNFGESQFRPDLFKEKTEDYSEVGMVAEFSDEMYPREVIARWYGQEIADAIFTPENMEMRRFAKDKINPDYSEPHFSEISQNIIAHYRVSFPVEPETRGDVLVEEIQSVFHRDVNQGLLLPGVEDNVRTKFEKFSAFAPDSPLRTEIDASVYGRKALITDIHVRVQNQTFIDAIEPLSFTSQLNVVKDFHRVGSRWAPGVPLEEYADPSSDATLVQRTAQIIQESSRNENAAISVNAVRRAEVLNEALDTARNTVNEIVSALRNTSEFSTVVEEDILSTINDWMPVGVNLASGRRSPRNYRLKDKSLGAWDSSDLNDPMREPVYGETLSDEERSNRATIAGLVTRAAGTSGIRNVTDRCGSRRAERYKSYAHSEYDKLKRRVSSLVSNVDTYRRMSDDGFFNSLVRAGVDPFIFDAVDEFLRSTGRMPVDAPMNRALVRDYIVNNLDVLRADSPFPIYFRMVSAAFEKAFNPVSETTQLNYDQGNEVDEFTQIMRIALTERAMKGMISNVRFTTLPNPIGSKCTVLEYSLDRKQGGGELIHVASENIMDQLQNGRPDAPDTLRFSENFIRDVESINIMANKVDSDVPESDDNDGRQRILYYSGVPEGPSSLRTIIERFGYKVGDTAPGPLVADLRDTDVKVVNDWIDPVFQAIVNEVKKRTGTPKVGNKVVFTRAFEAPQWSRMPANLSTKKYGWTVEEDVLDMEQLRVAEENTDLNFVRDLSAQIKSGKEAGQETQTKGVYRQRLEAFTKKFGGQLVYEQYGNMPHKRMQLVFDQKLVDSVQGQFPLFSMRRGAAGAWDRYMVNFIDRHQALRLYADQQRRRGALPDANNPYLGLRLLPGILSARVQRLNRQYRGILRQMFDAGVDLDMMDQFLTAQHARERNENIAARNPAMPDGGSGMMTADADMILNGHRASGTYDMLDRLAGQWRDMLNSALAERYTSGMMTTEDYQRLSRTYQNYVPLRGRPADPFEEDFEGGQAFGGGMSAQGVGMPRAYGRESRAENVTSQVAFVVEDTLRRAERNRVANRFLRMVLDINDVGFAEVIYPTTRMDIRGVTETVFDRNWSRDPRNFGLYADADMTINGRNYARGDLVIVRLNNGNLQKSLGRSLDLSLLRGVMNTPNNLFREMTTGLLAPTWMLRNIARDFSTGVLRNYANYGLRDTVMSMARWPLAFGRVMADEWINREPTGSYARYIDNGGSMAPYGPNDLEMQAEAFDRMYDEVRRIDPGQRITAQRVFSRNFILGAYRAAFTASETASRLAIFNQRLARGDSVENSVLAGRDVTVDFAKGGYYKPFFNTVWLYWNASMQGSANTLDAVRRSPGMGIALLGVGFFTALMNRMNAGDDDETEMNRWDQVSRMDKANKLYMFNPDKSGKAISVPQPYGFNIFTALGQDIADMTYGDRVRPQDVFLNLMDNSLNYLNAFGGSGVTQGLENMVSFAFPTVFRFMPELAQNADFAGRAIYPENPYAPETAEAYQAFENTPEIYRQVAEMANRLGGGNEIDEPVEILDWSPDSLEYMIGFMFSGFGRELQRIYTTATGETKGSEAPIVRDFTYDAQNNERFVVGEFNDIKKQTQLEKYRVSQMKQDAERFVPGAPQRDLGELNVDAMDTGIRDGIDRVADISKQIRQSRKTNLSSQDVENLKNLRMDLMREVIRRRNQLTRER